MEPFYPLPSLRLAAFFILLLSLSVVSYAQSIEEAQQRGADLRRRWKPLPPIDEVALQRSGIRKIESKHLALFTDLPPSKDIDELPPLFDQAVDALCGFFELKPKDYESFRAEGFLIDDFEKFKPSGAVQQVAKLRNGYALRQRLWMRNPDSNYYRRHLLIHEGVHLFMEYAFGDWGPPWYREGTAELLGTHRWENGKLELGCFPKHRNELPGWGRIEMLQNDFRSNTAKTLNAVFALSPEDYNENEAYSWSWAFAAFCIHHPLYREAYRKTALHLKGKPENVADRFLALVNDEVKRSVKTPLNETQVVDQLENEWADFVRNVEYGYDFERTAISFRQPPQPFGAAITVLADRGWQDSGIVLERGKTYKISAAGRYQVGSKPAPWMSEPNGITIRYYHGMPLGALLATQIPDIDERFLVKYATPGTNFAFPFVVGCSTEWKAQITGRLYFRINDFPSELDDNSGSAKVHVAH